MYSNFEFVAELTDAFELYQKPNGRYEVVPKEDGWMCLLNSTLGGNVDHAWVYRWGEDTYVFVLDDEAVEMYHFDFWNAMLEQTEKYDSVDVYEA